MRWHWASAAVTCILLLGYGRSSVLHAVLYTWIRAFQTTITTTHTQQKHPLRHTARQSRQSSSTPLLATKKHHQPEVVKKHKAPQDSHKRHTHTEANTQNLSNSHLSTHHTASPPNQTNPHRKTVRRRHPPRGAHSRIPGGPLAPPPAAAAPLPRHASPETSSTQQRQRQQRSRWPSRGGSWKRWKGKRWRWRSTGRRKTPGAGRWRRGIPMRMSRALSSDRSRRASCPGCFGLLLVSLARW